MNALDLNERCQSLSADDHELQRELDGLDEQLRAWLTAVQGLRLVPVQTELGESAPREKPAGKAVAAKPEAEPPPERAEPAADVTAGPVAEEPAKGAGPAADEPAKSAGPAADESAKSAAPAEPAADNSEDEALLAELAPEVANAVRVKRRLTGNRRSIRELIAEVEAARRGPREREARASSPPRPKRLQWWSRKDD